MNRLLASLLIAVAGLLAAAAAARAAFPGPAGRIVFESARDATTNGGFFTIRPGGGSVEHLLGSAPSATSDPAPSPNGRLIAYAMNRDLWVANADGSATRRVTSGGHNDQEPAFSPDGRRLVFHRAGTGDLHVVGIDGRGLRDLTNDPGAVETQPAWSPDGTAIAYQRTSCTSAYPGSCLWSIPAAGGAPTLLTPEHPEPPTCEVDHTVSAADPSWSPDGRRIAFTDLYQCPNGGGLDIWVMNADGSGKLDLTHDDGTDDVHPAWSPDGRRITFASNRDDTSTSFPDIYTMAADGSAIARLTREAVRDEDPDWSVAPTRVKPRRLAARATRHGRRLTVAARLVLPSSAKLLCAGRVRVAAAGATRTARLDNRCRAHLHLRVPAAGAVSVTARYQGTRLIAPTRKRRI